jgi:hypothetical protein
MLTRFGNHSVGHREAVKKDTTKGEKIERKEK